MNVSLNWLSRHLDLTKYAAHEIADMLTTIGLEVEGMHSVESVKGGLNGVLVGEVITCEKHPDADKLSVTTVSLGNSIHQIVCGAPNVRAGQKVLVATIGCTLFPQSGEPFKIKKSKIRGVESEGMICAADEIGLGTDHSGIMVLDEQAMVGLPASQHLKLHSDTVFEIGLTPNRSDATCHLGVAKDLLAYLKVNKDAGLFLIPANISALPESDRSQPFQVSVLDNAACPRYSGLTISGLRVGPSPDWLKQLLQTIDVKSINNIVDITNFILHEYGQPLHAFDAGKIPSGRIVVQKLPGGSKFKALDGKEITLSDQDLMICDDQQRGLCIAGVYGGLNSGINDDTSSIFLESAHFSAKSVRLTSMRHNLRTDAAKVFEKGSDPNITVIALQHAASLILDLAGGRLSSDIIDIYPSTILPKQINVIYSKINDLLGLKISNMEILSILTALGMTIANADELSITVNVPTNKADVLRDVDVIEEILRVYGFNNIPIPTTIQSTISYSGKVNKNKIVNKIADHLSSIGFNEMMGLSLIDSKLCMQLLDIEQQNLVEINNTSNSNLDVMRPDLILSGLLSVVHNHNRQQQDLAMYEFGKQYIKLADDFEEKELLSLFLSGISLPENWISGKGKPIDFYSIKESVDQIFLKLGISNFQVKELNDRRFAYGLEFYRESKCLAKFGEIHPLWSKKLGLKSKVFAAEIFMTQIMDIASQNRHYVKQISKFPSVTRDLALIIDEDVQFSKLHQIALKVDKTILKSVSLFDVYKNSQTLGEGKKSYALSFVFESAEKTLADADIDAIMQSLISKFEKEAGATLRI